MGFLQLSACSEQTATKEYANQDIETKDPYESETNKTDTVSKEDEQNEVPTEDSVEVSVNEPAVIDWETALEELVSDHSSKTEKADAAERLARDYTSSEDG